MSQPRYTGRHRRGAPARRTRAARRWLCNEGGSGRQRAHHDNHAATQRAGSSPQTAPTVSVSDAEARQFCCGKADFDVTDRSLRGQRNFRDTVTEEHEAALGCDNVNRAQFIANGVAVLLSQFAILVIGTENTAFQCVSRTAVPNLLRTINPSAFIKMQAN